MRGKVQLVMQDAASSLDPHQNVLQILDEMCIRDRFEVVIHDMPQDQAVEHIQRMRRFYNAGWKTIFEENAGLSLIHI